MPFFGLVGGGIKLHIALKPPKDNDMIVPIDHPQKWKAHRNPFHSLKLSRDDGNVTNDKVSGGGSAHTNDISKHNDALVLKNTNDLNDGSSSSIGTERTTLMSYNYDYQQQQLQKLQLSQDDTLYAYEATQDVAGIVTLIIPSGKKAEHLGMKVEFVGRIDSDHIGLDGRPHYDFISLSKELEPPCTIYDQRRTYPFNFPNVEKIHETYHGKHVSVHYFIRVALERKFLPPLTKEREVIVQKLTLLNNVMAMSASSAPVNNTSKNGGDKKDKNNEKKDNIGGGVVVAAAAGDDNDEPIKMEVGIEDCLHIEFEYKKRHYHLQDVIEGNVNFLLVRIRIKYMELTLLRRETAGSLVGGTISSIGGGGIGGGGFGGTNTIEGGQGSNVTTETQVLLKYEVMDGAPVRGEVIPVKLFLRGVPADLTPTYSAGHNSRFCVRYFINLVLVDEEDRRYFKQSEIILHRTALG